MSDNYQAVYDAVRSKIGNVDVGSAVESAMRNENISHYFMMAAENFRCTLAEYERPSAIYKPKLFIDHGKWCALYGENLQDGVCGFGESPKEAMFDFDKAWETKL